MHSRVATLLGELEGKSSSRPAWMRSSYDFSTVFPESRIITYGGDSCVSDEMGPLSDCSVGGDAAHSMIWDTGI